MGASQSSPMNNYPPANITPGYSFGSGSCVQDFLHTYDTLIASSTLTGPYGHLNYSNFNVGTPYAQTPSINWTSPVNYARASAARAAASGSLPNITILPEDEPIYTHFRFACARAGPAGYGTQEAVPCNITVAGISSDGHTVDATAFLAYTPIYNATSGRALMADALDQTQYYKDIFPYNTAWRTLVFNATDARTAVPVDLHIDDFHYSLGRYTGNFNCQDALNTNP